MSKALRGIIVFVLLTAAACQKKKYPVPENSTEAVFYAKMLVNSQPLDINAGKNGYYMFSSYRMDSAGLYTLSGELRQTGCSSCGSSIRFEVNDSKHTQPNAPIDIDAALRVKKYSFSNMGTMVMFNAAANKPASSYKWTFDDGETSNEANPSHVFGAGDHRVILTTTHSDGSQSTLINTIHIGTDNELNAYVTTAALGDTVVFTPHVSGGKAPYTYEWDFGDRSKSTSATVSHIYRLKGGYAVKLKVTDADGKIVLCNYNAVAGADASAFASNFSFSLSGSFQTTELSKVTIHYTDANGVEFSSDYLQQPYASSLEIISVEEFVKNELGQPVKKVKLKFSCTLYNGAQSVSLQGNEVTVGFAYK